MKNTLTITYQFTVVLVIFTFNVQVEPKGVYFIGSSAFMIASVTETEENPKFYQLNLGVRLTKEDSISLEAIKWKYYGPLGSDQIEKYRVPPWMALLRWPLSKVFSLLLSFTVILTCLNQDVRCFHRVGVDPLELVDNFNFKRIGSKSLIFIRD